MPIPLPPHAVPNLERWIVSHWRPVHAVRDRRQASILALCLHGLRRTEVSRALVKHLNVVTGTLYVQTLKKGHRRMVPLSWMTIERLLSTCEAALKRPPEPNDFLVPGVRGQQYDLNGQNADYLTRILDQVVGVGYSLHSLRHTAAQRMWDATHDIHIVQTFLGHRHTHSTWTYLASMKQPPPDVLPDLDPQPTRGAQSRRLRLFDPDPPRRKWWLGRKGHAQ